jgi:hypothetical protein
MAWTTTDLLAEVRRIGQLPTASTSSLADSDLLAQGDRAMQAAMVPLLLRVQEEFFVRRVSQALTSGVGAYPIPRRAIGSRVRDVMLVRSGVRSPLPRLRPEQLVDFITTSTGQPYGFYLDAANIILLPAPSTADSLAIALYVRPGRFVATTTCRQLTAVTADTPTAGRTRLTFASFSTWGSTVDLISYQPPFEVKAMDIATANVTTTTFDVATADLLATPVVGDWVASPDTSPVMQVPVEAQPLLCQRTAQYCLEALGYLEEASMVGQRGDRMESDVTSILTPRTDGQPKRVTGGLLRLINQGYGGWRW